MKKNNKILLYAIICFFTLFFCLTNSFAEYCFEIPDKKTHDDSETANKNVFESGKLLFMVFEELEKKNIGKANEIMNKIKENAGILLQIYESILKRVEDVKLNINKLRPESRNYFNYLMDINKYTPPKTMRPLIEIGTKQIKVYKDKFFVKEINFGNDIKSNRTEIIDLADKYYTLINVGFLISEIAFTNNMQ